MSNLIDEKGNEIGHPEKFDMSIYEEKIKGSNPLDNLYKTALKLKKKNKELKKENAELKAKLNGALDICNIPEFRINDLAKRIIKQQKTIGSLTDIIDELKAQIGKMQNVGNCKHAMDCAKFNEKELIYGKIITCKNCKDWGLAE